MRADLEPRFYTLDEVAGILTLRKSQVYALLRSGELPGVKFGGRGVWRVERAKLDQYIERMHQQTAQWTRSHPLSPGPDGDAPPGNEDAS
jgi:excisionase family DNA binding protein